MLRLASRATVALTVGSFGSYHLLKPPAPVLEASKAEDVDALIIGGGIMGATVAVMLQLLQPDWKVKLVEQHNGVAQEASNEWNNAGTGHAALCEPNYTPAHPVTGEVEIDKAVATNSKFMTSLAFWSFLVQKHILPDANFIQPAPHILFVHGEKGRSWLRKRVDKLSKLPAFAATEYSEDYDKIKSWAGLLCDGRPREGGEVIACSRHPDGTEVNCKIEGRRRKVQLIVSSPPPSPTRYLSPTHPPRRPLLLFAFFADGLLTRNLVQSFSELGGDVQLLTTVTGLRQESDKRWLVALQRSDLSSTNQTVRARFVFAGAGGGSLAVLQKAGIPEVAGYGGMPVSGKFLVCQKTEVIEQNFNKVYGQAAIDAPPMSVPHLDWRYVGGGRKAPGCAFFVVYRSVGPLHPNQPTNQE
jgi:malate dehydrogenase (quinone)